MPRALRQPNGRYGPEPTAAQAAAAGAGGAGAIAVGAAGAVGAAATGAVVGATAYKKSQYFMMLRLSVTGKTATPLLFATMAVLGQKKVFQRIDQAILLVKGKHDS